MKKISLITLISFFFLIPNVDAGYKTIRTTDYHYYFFSEPYHNADQLTELKNEGTINYAKFASYRIWEDVSSISQVSLTKGCSTYRTQSWDSSDCWDLETFYRMWDELYYGKGTVVCKESTCSKDLKQSIRKGTRIYHSHGAHRSAGEATYHNEISRIDMERYNRNNTPGMININNLSPNITLSDGRNFNASSEASLLACATIPEDNINKTAVRYLEGTENVIKIERNLKSTSTITEEGKVDWDASPSGHLATCSTDPINAYNGIGGSINNLSDKGVYSPALYRIKVVTDKFNCIAESPEKNGECNNTVSVSSECEKKTFEVVEDGKSIDNPDAKAARATVGFTQNITLTNLLTPTKIYQGGGVKIGFIYKSTVTATIIETIGDFEQLKGKIYEKIRNTILDSGTVENNISNAAELTFTDENGKNYKISPALMQTKCEPEGDIIDDGKVTMTCTILLPESEVALGTGEVTYKSNEGKGINNEFYTPIKYNGDLYMAATFGNLTAVNGSELDGWMENVTVKYNGKTNPSSNCKVTTYPRFYNNDNKTYKFIYRPIDINEPFPDRNAGVNWYDWYNIPANKTRLKKSYSNLEYTMDINKASSSEIKNYNNNHKYFNWVGITEDGRSEFVQTYGGDTP